ncbi:GH3 auxin-responsive promoter family protein [Neolewinella lacunae]|uniref:GH3 auxin-responsive promoter family protein n=1 Tax=Neolewinella lacunae TaxID=1517758 RepID=A0A923PQJ4_9BACT|nr:GH3 auxin-responsive promoter family protein [Neolewinella lacunae]MBC6995613.1 GH3 auxin-responsive promoter family protein [Neolewinella lacunae]MDN3635649.1 GH3 auxin-responsive promoter family protein [Neolewinella lacunae]
MAFFGQIIKTLLETKHALLPHEPSDPVEAQERQLRKLLETAKNTAFGKFYNFSGLLEADDIRQAYAAAVPIHDYDALNERWWKQQRRTPDITWPGKPDFFALSSGTTGKKSKRIPVTTDMLACTQAVGRGQAECLANFDLPAELFEKDILMLTSSADLHEKDGWREGEISGINVSNLPDFMEGYYKPGLEIAKIADWDERVQRIAEAAPTWDVGALAGIPSWMVMMLRKVIEVNQLKNIHEIWPNLQVYTTGGVAFEPYRKSFEALLAHPIIIMDTYLASEGFFAFNARPGTMSMELAMDHGIYYEFIPHTNEGFDATGTLLEKPRVLDFREVEEDKDYALLVSTPAGAWRYMIGDTIKFTDKAKMEMVITGRTKYWLNVVGSQLSEEKLNAAIQALNDALDCDVKEFTVGAIATEEGDDYLHQWVLGMEKGQVTEEQAAAFLDEHLQSVNKNYQVARSKALRGVKVKITNADTLYRFLEKKKQKGGQIKFPKVMAEEDLRGLLAFMKE